MIIKLHDQQNVKLKEYNRANKAETKEERTKTRRGGGQTDLVQIFGNRKVRYKTKSEPPKSTKTGSSWKSLGKLHFGSKKRGPKNGLRPDFHRRWDFRPQNILLKMKSP